MGMSQETYDEIPAAAAQACADETLGADAHARAVHAIERELSKKLDSMIDQGKVLLLSNEEQNMIQAFRLFKLRMQKEEETFQWLSNREVSPEASLVVEAPGQFLISDPHEASR